LVHEISGISLIKDRLANLGKRYICNAESRRELMELLVSENNATKSIIQKDGRINPLCLFQRKIREINSEIK
jgi:hypothetical protein